MAILSFFFLFFLLQHRPSITHKHRNEQTFDFHDPNEFRTNATTWSNFDLQLMNFNVLKVPAFHRCTTNFRYQEKHLNFYYFQDSTPFNSKLARNIRKQRNSYIHLWVFKCLLLLGCSSLRKFTKQVFESHWTFFIFFVFSLRSGFNLETFPSIFFALFFYSCRPYLEYYTDIWRAGRWN